MAPFDAKEDASPSLAASNRRQFLLTTGSTMAAGVVAACVPAYAASTGEGSGFEGARLEKPEIEGAVPITLRINGKEQPLRIDPRTTLLDCIRESALLTGTKKGCDHGQCGACTVHVSGR